MRNQEKPGDSSILIQLFVTGEMTKHTALGSTGGAMDYRTKTTAQDRLLARGLVQVRQGPAIPSGFKNQPARPGMEYLSLTDAGKAEVQAGVQRQRMIGIDMEATKFKFNYSWLCTQSNSTQK